MFSPRKKYLFPNHKVMSKKKKGHPIEINKDSLAPADVNLLLPKKASLLERRTIRMPFPRPPVNNPFGIGSDWTRTSSRPCLFTVTCFACRQTAAAAAASPCTRTRSTWRPGPMWRPTRPAAKRKTDPKCTASSAARQPARNSAASATAVPATQPRPTSRQPRWTTSRPAPGGRARRCKTATSTTTWRSGSIWKR